MLRNGAAGDSRPSFRRTPNSGNSGDMFTCFGPELSVASPESQRALTALSFYLDMTRAGLLPDSQLRRTMESAQPKVTELESACSDLLHDFRQEQG